MHLHDTILSYSKQLKKNCTILRNYNHQTSDAAETLKNLRLHFEEGQKREEGLWSELEEAQTSLGKNRGSLLRNYELLERNKLKNNGLREKIIVMDEELEAARRSAKESEEQSAHLRESTKKLFEEVSLAKEKSSEAERLLEENKEEQARLLA